MKRAVRADAIVVGDVVVLPTATGAVRLRVRELTVRSATIKFVGRTRRSETDWGWGWKPDEVVVRVRRAKG